MGTICEYIYSLFFQVPNPLIIDNRHNGYFQALTDPTSLHFLLLSPEQISNLATSKYEIDFDVYKSDVFSIGMLILDLISLGNRKFYDKGSINWSAVDGCMGEVSKLYSVDLGNMLRGCLEAEEKDRWGFA